MVTPVTSLGRSGLSDWLIQRVSAIVILLYVLCHTAILISNPDMDYLQWRAVFADTAMKIFSLVTLAALCAHAWIGMWTVITDYLSPHLMGSRATAIRLLLQVVCLGVLAVYFIWGVMILWSV